MPDQTPFHVPSAHIDAAAVADVQLRWYVRLEYFFPARFGAPPRDALRWAAFPYVGRHADGSPRRVGQSTGPFNSRDDAISYATARTAEARARAVRLAADEGHVL